MTCLSDNWPCGHAFLFLIRVFHPIPQSGSLCTLSILDTRVPFSVCPCLSAAVWIDSRSFDLKPQDCGVVCRLSRQNALTEVGVTIAYSDSF